jgi:hypothetical protein
MRYRTVPKWVEICTDPYISDPDSYFLFFVWFFFKNKKKLVICNFVEEWV